ncbi:MAG: transposase [Christensenellales bacterium]
MKWLDALQPEGLLGDTLEEYLTSFRYHQNKLERLDRRIEEISREERYREPVGRLCCLLGVKPLTALSVVSEVSDMHRFSTAEKFASYLGLVPCEHSSGNSVRRGGITKAGNVHVRALLTEAAQSYTRGKVGYKSSALKKRQSGQSETVIAYADRANERLRRRYYQMTLREREAGQCGENSHRAGIGLFYVGTIDRSCGIEFSTTARERSQGCFAPLTRQGLDSIHRLR